MLNFKESPEALLLWGFFIMWKKSNFALS